MPYNDYPQAATNNAKRAIKHREDNGSDCGTPVGWETARILANRETISHDRTVRAYSFLSRAKTYDQGKYTDADGNEICGSVMYDAWGGDAMLDWAKRKYEEMENKNMPAETERRTYKIEVRAQPESRVIEGYAAVFDTPTDMGWYVEEVAKGAFDDADDTDVVALFNHDANYPLARTSNSTLTLKVDEKGLFYSFKVPDTSFGNDLLEMVRSGLISQSSFAFTIRKDTWTNEYEANVKPRRRIEEVDVLFDVSPVTYPAYKETSATARALQDIRTAPQGVCDKDFPQLIADIIELSKKA
jgi:HK97 family phage prohead protease